MVLLPPYLLLLAAFLLHLNLKVRSRSSKAASFIGMWAALLASLYFALTGYTW